MKRINKVLALLLALLMVATALPLSILADAWVTVEAQTQTDPTTNTTDSVVTITVDPNVLLDLIESKGLSVELLFALKDGMALDKDALLQVFTVEELFEIIPKDRWEEVFDFDQIIDEIGLDVLNQYIQTDDYAAWLNSILDGDVETFERLLRDIPDLEKCVNPTLLYQMDYLVPTEANVAAGKSLYDLIAAHVYDPDALAGMLVVDAELTARIESEISVMPYDDIREMFDLDHMYNDGFFSDADVKTEDTVRTKMCAIARDEALLKEVLKPSNGYVNGVAVLETFGIEFVIHHVNGGAAAVINPVVMDLCPATGLLSELDLVATLTKVCNGLYTDLKPDGTVLLPEDLFDYDRMIDALDKLDMLDDVVTSVGVSELLDRFTKSELLELIRKVNIKPYVKPLATMVLGQVLDNVKKIEIDGLVVAQATTAGAQQLQVKPGELLKALTALVPGFEDLLAEDFDGTVLSPQIKIEYKVADATDPDYGEIKTKSLTLNAVLGGGEAVLAKFQSGVEKLKALYNVYINELGLAGTDLTLDMNITPAFAELLCQIVNSDELDDDLKQKIAMLAEGDNLYTFVSGDLTFDNVDAILNAIDLEALYAVIRNAGYTQILLEKFDALTGSKTSEKSLQDIMDFITKDTHTIHDLCDIVKQKFGYNVKAILEKAAIKFDAVMDRAEKIALVQKALDLVASKTGVNLAGISAEAVLNKAEDKPIIDTIIEIVSDKIGKDLDKVLTENTVDELYTKALDKVAQYEDKAEALLSKVRAVVAKIAQRFPNHSIANWYQGNGIFAFEADMTVSPKVWMEKLVNKLAARFNLGTAAIDLLMSHIADDEMIITADLTFRVENLYRITFMGNDAVNDPYALPLFSAFLPVGADLSIFKNNPVTTRFDFADWWTYDENGNPVAITTMPEGDIVVYTNGVRTKDVVEENLGYQTIITDPYWRLEYGLKITLSREILARAAKGELVTYEVLIDKDGAKTSFVKFDTKTLRRLSLIPGEISFYYGNGYLNAVNAGNSSFAGGIYDQSKVGAASAPEYHSFKLVGENGEISVFGGEITITLPYSGQMSTNPVRTEVYTTADGKREWMENATLDFANKLVTFTTTHFSDFVILNSYKMDVKFVTGDGVAIDAKIKDFDQAHPYYPAGYELKFENFYGFGSHDKIVKIIASVGGVDTDYTAMSAYVLAGNDVILTVTLENVYYIYYYVNGIKWNEIEYYTSELVNGELPANKAPKTFDDLLTYIAAANDAKLLPPDGFTMAGSLIGFDKAFLGKADMNVFARWTPVEYKYTISLMVDNKLFDTIEINSAAIDPMKVLEDVDLPEVPAKAGYMGEWTLVSTLANERSFTLVATYAANRYLVATDGNSYVKSDGNAWQTGGLFEVGEQVQVGTQPKDHFDAKIVVVRATKDANGNDVAVKVVNGVFTMPADAVNVSVVYVPKTYTYTVDGVTGFGTYGDTVFFEILVPADQVLTAVDGDDSVLIWETVNKNQTMTKTYAFVLTKDGMSFTSEFANKELAPVINIFDGTKYTGEGDPVVDVDGVKFDGWSKALQGFSFAKFAFDDSQGSMWAPWILVALLIFVLLIVILYLFNRKGDKPRKNFCVVFALAAMELFFAGCHKVSGAFLKIGRRFGKGDKASDYGFVEEDGAEKLPEDTDQE